jgi:hypothetical protein
MLAQCGPACGVKAQGSIHYYFYYSINLAKINSKLRGSLGSPVKVSVFGVYAGVRPHTPQIRGFPTVIPNDPIKMNTFLANYSSVSQSLKSVLTRELYEAFPFRRAMISPIMLTAISSGVSASISSPIGE